MPDPKSCDNSETYLKEFQSKSYLLRMMEDQKPKTEEMDLKFLLKSKNEEKKQEIEWEPAPILSCTYADHDCKKVLVSSTDKFAGFVYLIDWTKDRPISKFAAPKVPTTYMKFWDDENMLLMGFQDGSIQLRHRIDLNNWVSLQTHDISYGKVSHVVINQSKNFVLSSGEDGTLYSYQLDYDTFMQGVKGNPSLEVAFEAPKGGITEITFTQQIEIADVGEEDILDPKIYSIQEAKLLAEEDFKKKEADKKKQIKLKQIKQLVERFEEVKQKNLEIDEVARLNREEMTVDAEYNQMLNKRVEEDLEETKLELKWDAEYARLMTQKLKNYMINELEVNRFAVKGIKNNKVIVYTFKVPKLSKYTKQNLEEIYQQIEQEQNIKDEFGDNEHQANQPARDQLKE